jgi:arylsulfatase A-like enzyme
MHLRGSRRTRTGSLAIVAVTVTLIGAGVLPAGAQTGGGNVHPHSRARSPHLAAVHDGSPVTPSRVKKKAPADRPNIVFVLTDDLSKNLIRYMPNVRALKRRGMTFTNYTVSNSLCCPSRASIFTGELPHNTGVKTNTAPSGGYAAFQAHGDDTKTFAVMAHKAGYRTGFFGKYFNGYSPRLEPQNPPGWDRWGAVNGRGYSGYHYRMSLDGKLRTYGGKPRAYMTTVLDNLGNQFISSSLLNHQKFLLEVSTFAPHFPGIPAPQDEERFPHIRAPRSLKWNTLPTNAPPWLATRPGLTKDQIARCNKSFRSRVLSVQAVDRMVGHLEDTLAQWGELNNTIFVFSSDNGFHIGDYALTPGKLLAFDTDVNVPLIVAGPGIAHGSVNNDLVQNIDLAPTFARLTGAHFSQASVDGHSFEPLLNGKNVPWRTLAVVEHTWPGHNDSDPDEQGIPAGNPPSYTAIRATDYTYVRYQHYASADTQEYYDRENDPQELDNIYGSLKRK